MTWFRRQLEVEWISVDGSTTAEEIAARIISR
jgi:hypothetical protein